MGCQQLPLSPASGPPALTPWTLTLPWLLPGSHLDASLHCVLQAPGSCCGLLVTRLSCPQFVPALPRGGRLPRLLLQAVLSLRLRPTPGVGASLWAALVQLPPPSQPRRSPRCLATLTRQTAARSPSPGPGNCTRCGNCLQEDRPGAAHEGRPPPPRLGSGQTSSLFRGWPPPRPWLRPLGKARRLPHSPERQGSWTLGSLCATLTLQWGKLRPGSLGDLEWQKPGLGKGSGGPPREEAFHYLC